MASMIAAQTAVVMSVGFVPDPKKRSEFIQRYVELHMDIHYSLGFEPVASIEVAKQEMVEVTERAADDMVADVLKEFGPDPLHLAPEESHEWPKEIHADTN